MRRGTVEFYRKATIRPALDVYWQLDGCKPETYLLCVPIPLPPDEAERLGDPIPLPPDEVERFGEVPVDPTPIKFCRLVVSLASTQDKSLLHHLSNVDLRHEVADLILFETIDLIKKLVPFQ